MTWFDYVIIGTITLSALISLLRGFVREAFSLAIWLLAFWISWTFFQDLSMRLEGLIETPTVRLGISFAILMIASLMLGGLVNYLLIQLVEKTGLTGTDRLIGMVFGVARGALLVAVLVIVAGLTPIPQDKWWKESVLVPYFEELAQWLLDLLPPDVSDRFRYATAMDGGSVDVVWNTHRPTDTRGPDVVWNTHRPTDTRGPDVVWNTHRPTAMAAPGHPCPHGTPRALLSGRICTSCTADGGSEENAWSNFLPTEGSGGSPPEGRLRAVDVVWNIHRPTASGIERHTDINPGLARSIN